MRQLVLVCVVLLLVLFSGREAEAVHGAGLAAERFPQTISSARFGEIAEGELRSSLQEIGEQRRYELSPLRIPMDMQCPDGALICEARLPKKLNYGVPLPVEISVFVNGKVYRRVVCYYRVRVFDRILVAARDLPLERRMAEGDVRIEEREVAFGAVYFKDTAVLAKKVPSRIIRAGTPLTAAMLRNPIVLDVGAQVKIRSVNASFMLEVDGITMQRGRVDEIIRVRNATSGKILRARVVDEKTVEVL